MKRIDRWLAAGRWRDVAAILATALLLRGGCALLSFMLDAPWLRRWIAPDPGMAIDTALGMCMVSVSLMLIVRYR